MEVINYSCLMMRHDTLRRLREEEKREKMRGVWRTRDEEKTA